MQSVKAILEALADHLETLVNLEGADAIFPNRMGSLPRAILTWNDVPEIDVGIASLLQVKHSIDVYIVVAPRSSISQATDAVISLVHTVIEHILKSVTLLGKVTQLRPTKIRPATIQLGEEVYFAFVITLDVEDKGEYEVGA